jgi:hypothetical protein
MFPSNSVTARYQKLLVKGCSDMDSLGTLKSGLGGNLSVNSGLVVAVCGTFLGAVSMPNRQGDR